MKDSNKTNYTISRHPEGDNPKDLSTLGSRYFNDATTCAPLVEEPKSLISKGGKNMLDYNQEPSPEFVSSSQLTNKFYPQLLHTDSHVSPPLNGSLCITEREGKKESVTNLFPYFPISLSLKKLRRFRIKSGMTFIKQAAFTLAETLITLGIIGVVAAMTIPNLITTHQQKVTVTKLKKSISIVNQAYRLSIADQGQPQIDDALTMDLEDYFKKYWAPYIKYSTYCKTYDICGYSSKLPFKTLAGNNWTYQLTPDANFTFETNDAMVYSIQIRGYCSKPKCEYVNGKYGTDGSMNVLIDINGSKGPNILGKDVFYLNGSLIDIIGIQPAGYSYSTDVINENCSKKGIGRYCAEMIKRAGWEIGKNYPWK